MPVWAAHVKGLTPSPSRLEKDLLFQTSKLNYCNDRSGSYKTKTLEPDSDRDFIDLGALDPLERATDEENRLFYSAKIEYVADDCDGSSKDETDHNTQTSKDDEPPVSENPTQPTFVGTSRIEKLFLFMQTFLKMPSFISTTRQLESGHKKRLSSYSALPHAKLFENCLTDGSRGYKYSNGYTCICLFAQIRLIILEDFDFHDDEDSPISNSGRRRTVIKGGLNFLFLNPKYAEKGTRIMQELLCQHTSLRHDKRGASAHSLINVFCNIMTLFHFPMASITVKLDCGLKLISDLGKFIEIYFHGDQRLVNGEEKVMTADDSHLAVRRLTCVNEIFFSIGYTAKTIRVKTVRYVTENRECTPYFSTANFSDTDVSQPLASPIRQALEETYSNIPTPTASESYSSVSNGASWIFENTVISPAQASVSWLKQAVNDLRLDTI